MLLRGLSTGDFREALPVLLGEAAAGRSPTTITRLTAEWEMEYPTFQPRDLSDRDDVYIWVDGVHFTIRLEDDRLCTLVVIGVRADGVKTVLAVEDGDRESAIAEKLRQQRQERELTTRPEGGTGPANPQPPESNQR